MLKKIYNKVTHEWDTSVEEALKSFIRLPALSPDFDKKWEENGVLLKALEDAQAWAEKQGIKGLRCEIIKDDGFTPLQETELGICQVGWYRGNRSFRPFAFQQRNERIFCYID